MVQAHIIYSGLVQGVGFRFSVQRFAAHLALKGWVKNLKDGRVEILVEGSREEIDSLIKNIETRFEGNIRDKQLGFSETRSQFRDFHIVY